MVLKCLFLNLARQESELMTNLDGIMLQTGHLEPLVLIIPAEIGVLLGQWSVGLRSRGLRLTRSRPARLSITCLTIFGLYAHKLAR